MQSESTLTTKSKLQPHEGHAIGFVLRLGRALHTYGYSADRLEAVLTKTSTRLGLVSQFFSTPTSIFVAFGDQDTQHTFLIRVEPGEVNLGKLADLDVVTSKVLSGQLSPADGSIEIEKIIAAPHEYNDFLRVLAFGLASAASSRFLGGGLKEILISSGIGLMIGLLSLLATKSSSFGRVFEPVAAFAASGIAAMLTFVVGSFSVSNATLAGLIVLIPGLTLTVAMSELSTRNLVSGTARFSGALVLFMSIGFGVALGQKIVESIYRTPHIADPHLLPAWTEFVALVIAPLSFMILLRAHLVDGIWILIAGALAVTGSRLGARALGPELGVFAGALTVGLVSNLLARWRDRPAAITLVPGILLLVPGSIGFRSLASLLDRQVVSGVDTAFKMTLMAVALVAGMLIANTVVPSRRTLG
ncbi:MAG TPA: threonine/serine exporter family protein [Blastocatellia bacterium]|nr:threonine/serine exporter family protein [Blastocatellia bacterium]